MKNNLKAILLIFIIFSFSILAPSCVINIGNVNKENSGTNQIINPFEKQQNYHSSGLHRELFEFLKQNYYQEIPEHVFYQAIDKSTEEFVKSFVDRYTRVTFNEAVRILGPFGSAIEKEMFNGYGFSYQNMENKLIVTDVFKNGNAKNKLYPKDEIIGLKDKNNEKIYFKNHKFSPELIAKMLKAGANETTPKILLIKRNEEEKEISLFLKPFHNATVERIDTKNPNFASIRINQFEEFTGDIFLEFLKQAEKDTLTDENKTLIIDLRNNPGGVVTSLKKIVENLLVKRNNPYFLLEQNPKSKNKKPLVEVYGTLREKKVYNIKVLVNKNSASASEILAAVLHHGGNYEVIGEETFGKNVYQDHAVLANGFINLTYTRGYWKYFDFKENTFKIIEKEKNPIPVTKIEVLEVYDFFEKPYLKDLNVGYDSVNLDIKYIQNFLNYYFKDEADFEKIRNDGYFDKKTEVLIEKFQKLNKLNVTKIIDIETKNKIYDYYLDLLFTVEKDIFYNQVLK